MKLITGFFLVAGGLLLGQSNPPIPFAPQIQSGTILPNLCNNGNLQYNPSTYLWANCGPTNTWNMFSYGVSGSSVTNFLAPSGSWPNWLIPSVTLSTTTPTLGVTAVTQGNGSKVQLSTGSTVSGHCVEFDANGNTVDFGSPCQTGSGTITPNIPIGGSNSSGIFQIGTFLQSGTGAVSETAQTKLAQIVNTADFGAVCNGSTDDTSAFQHAHDSLSSRGGGTVVIQSGVCVINSNINVTLDNIKWWGQGQAATTIQLGSSVTKLFNVTNGTSTNLVLPQFEDFSITGTAAAAGSCFYFDSVRNGFINNVQLNGCFKGININGVTGEVQVMRIENVNISSTPDVTAARAIYLNGGSGDDYIFNNMRVINQTPSINNTGFEVVSGNGIQSNYLDVSGFGRSCVFDPGANQNVNWALFNGLQCEFSFGDALTLDGTAAFGSGFPFALAGLTFVDSWFTDGGIDNGGNGNGINCVSANNVSVSNSQIYGSSFHGVRIQNGCKFVTLSHNLISGNSSGIGNGGINVGLYDGIHADVGSTFQYTLTGNTSGATEYFANTQRYGIAVGAGNGFFNVTGNDLYNNLTGGYSDGTGGAGTTTQVIGNIPTNVNTPIANTYFVTAPPGVAGALASNLPGDFASDTTNHLLYWCNATVGTAAPACTSVTANGWTLVGGGGGSTPQVNGTPISANPLNLQNATFAGLTFTWANLSGGNVTVQPVGTLDNAGLTHSFTTVNGQTCTLGSACTVSATGLPVTANGSAVATASTFNVQSGTYITQTVSNASGIVTYQPDVDTTKIPPNLTIQQGQLTTLVTTSASATTYTANMALADPIIAYVPNARYIWPIGSTACTGGATTLNIDGLGAPRIYSGLTGTIDPVASQCLAGASVTVTYDAFTPAWRIAALVPTILSGTSGSIGGSLLVAGACSSGTVTVTGATTGMFAGASPAGGVDPTNGGTLGVSIDARVSSTNTVTVSVCSPIAGTPTASTYNVRVM